MPKFDEHKDKITIRKCKTCDVTFRYRGRSTSDRAYCYDCRQEMYHHWYHNVWIPWFNSLSDDKKVELKEKRLEQWHKWVGDNQERRRQQALASYHRTKAKHLKKKRLWRKKFYKKTGR